MINEIAELIFNEVNEDKEWNVIRKHVLDYLKPCSILDRIVRTEKIINLLNHSYN